MFSLLRSHIVLTGPWKCLHSLYKSLQMTLCLLDLMGMSLIPALTLNLVEAWSNAPKCPKYIYF